jgi:hypothetical protein
MEGRASGSLAIHPRLPVAAIAVKPGHIRLVNIDTLQEYATFPGGDPLAFSAAGDHLTALDGESHVQVFDLAALRQRLRPVGLDWPDPQVHHP